MCRAAFTLIELLVVVAVIALLISIMLPALGGAKASAKQTQCLSNLRSIGISLHIYLHEFRRIDQAAYIPPPFGWNKLPPVIVPPLPTILREVGLDPANKIYKCPCDEWQIYSRCGLSYFWGLNGPYVGGAECDATLVLLWDVDDAKTVTVGNDIVPLGRSHSRRSVLYGDSHAERQGPHQDLGWGFGPR